MRTINFFNRSSSVDIEREKGWESDDSGEDVQVYEDERVYLDHVGYINLTDKVVIADPCYEGNEPLKGTFAPGEYEVMVSSRTDDGRTFRVQHKHESIVREQEIEGWFVMDSGQAGLWAEDEFNNADKYEPIPGKAEWGNAFYQCACELSLSKGFGIMHNGFVCESGYGDGGYIVQAGYNADNKICGIVVIY